LLCGWRNVKGDKLVKHKQVEKPEVKWRGPDPSDIVGGVVILFFFVRAFLLWASGWVPSTP
jgi:hypothetical protein